MGQTTLETLAARSAYVGCSAKTSLILFIFSTTPSLEPIWDIQITARLQNGTGISENDLRSPPFRTTDIYTTPEQNMLGSSNESTCSSSGWASMSMQFMRLSSARTATSCKRSPQQPRQIQSVFKPQTSHRPPQQPPLD